MSTDTSQGKFDVEYVLRRFMSSIRHGCVLGLELVEVTPPGVLVKLPYSEKIIGNPETGVIHGGAITTLMDQASGMAVVVALSPGFDVTPTIDLRIDYMRPAEPGKDVYAYVESYRKTKHVIFTRGIAYQEDRDRPIAHCVANFTRMGLNRKPWEGPK